MKRKPVSLNVLQYIDLYDVFDGLNINMGWFYDAQVMFGDNNYSLITVRRVREIITPYADFESITIKNSDAQLATEMLARLEGYSEQTLINLEK